MKIKLKGHLPTHLLDLGLRPGNKFDAEPALNTRLDAVKFIIIVDDEQYVCTVLPKNYEKI